MGHALLDEGFRLVAYRGGGGERPENTLAAFEHATSLGTDVVIELDVRRSADGELVAIHDERVDRTTDGSGAVSALRYEELSKLNAGEHFTADGAPSFREAKLRIPRVAEVLSSFPRQRFVLDVHSNHPNISADLLKLVRDHRASDRVVIASEISSVVQAVQREQPDWLFAGTAGQLLSRVLLERVGLDGLAPRTGGVLMIPEVHKSLRVLSPRFLQQAHGRGERVWVWVVERVADMQRLRQMGVDAVFTPYPAAFSQQASVRSAAAE